MVTAIVNASVQMVNANTASVIASVQMVNANTAC